MDISKAIDAQIQYGSSHSTAIRKALDGREVVGTKMGMPGKSVGQKPGQAFKLQDEGDGKTSDGKDIALHKARLGMSIEDGGHRRDLNITAPATPDAQKWSGWGTALKPANEPICLARKPLSESTIAKNVLRWNTGGLNIDESRIQPWEREKTPSDSSAADAVRKQKLTTQGTQDSSVQGLAGTKASGKGQKSQQDTCKEDTLCSGGMKAESLSTSLSIEECGNNTTDQYQTGLSSTTPTTKRPTTELKTSNSCPEVSTTSFTGPSGRFPSNVIFDEDAAAVLDQQAAQSVSQFFYQAKASKSDRGEGNTHPTVKPIKLMEYLIKLVTPEGGVVLDPFMGSGTTGVAAVRSGYQFRGIEMDEKYFYICQARLEKEKAS